MMIDLSISFIPTMFFNISMYVINYIKCYIITWWIGHFSIMKKFSLAQQFLKSDVTITTNSFILLLFTWYIFSHHSIFNLSVSLYVSLINNILKMQSYNLWIIIYNFFKYMIGFGFKFVPSVLLVCFSFAT